MKETTKISLINHAISDQNKIEITGNKSALSDGVMPDVIKRPIYGFGNGCRKCIFSDLDSSRCSRPDELDCYDDKTEQDYYFAKKA